MVLGIWDFCISRQQACEGDNPTHRSSLHLGDMDLFTPAKVLVLFVTGHNKLLLKECTENKLAAYGYLRNDNS